MAKVGRKFFQKKKMAASKRGWRFSNDDRERREKSGGAPRV